MLTPRPERSLREGRLHDKGGRTRGALLGRRPAPLPPRVGVGRGAPPGVERGENQSEQWDSDLGRRWTRRGEGCSRRGAGVGLGGGRRAPRPRVTGLT